MEKEDEASSSSALWQEPIMERSMEEDKKADKTANPHLTERQLALSGFIERAARCLTEAQVKALRVKFSPADDTKCGLCGAGFWGAQMGVTLPTQRHHCYCCGKALCNACTVTVQMENGHQVDGRYHKDFVWTGKFCIDHDLITGRSKELSAKVEGGVIPMPSGALEWLGFVVKVGHLLVSVFPVVSTLSAAYRMSGVVTWGYRIVRLFV